MSFILSLMENKKTQSCLCAHVCVHVCVCERGRASHTGDRCMRSHYGNVVMKGILFESESTFWTFHFQLCNRWIYLEQEARGQQQPAAALQRARPCVNSGWCTSPGSVWNPCSFTKVRSWKVPIEAIWREATALCMWHSLLLTRSFSTDHTILQS